MKKLVRKTELEVKENKKLDYFEIIKGDTWIIRGYNRSYGKDTYKIQKNLEDGNVMIGHINIEDVENLINEGVLKKIK